MGVAWLVLIVIVTYVLSCTPFGRRLYAVGLFRHEPNPAGAPVRLNGLRRTDIAHHLAERFENTP